MKIRWEVEQALEYLKRFDKHRVELICQEFKCFEDTLNMLRNWVLQLLAELQERKMRDEIY